MPAARYWRARGVSTYGGGDLELGAFHLFSGVQGDEQYDKSALLLHGDGTVGSTTVVDSSARPKTITAYGAVALASGGAFGQSIAFNGGHLRVAANSDFDFGAGDFSVSCLLRVTSTPTTPGYYGAVVGCDNIGSVRGWLLLIDGDNGGRLSFTFFSGASGFVVSTSSAFPSNTRKHIRACRVGSYLYLFVDGVLVSTSFVGTAAINAVAAVQPFIGALQVTGGPVGTSLLLGDIEEMLIEKGFGRNSSDFSPPSVPYPNSSTSVFFREDAAATLTSAIAPLSGTVAALQDTDMGTVARLDARSPGFALQWDFGVGGSADVIAAQLGGGSTQALFLSRFDLQYSSDAQTWVTLARLGRFAYPGAGVLTDLDQSPLAALPHATSQRALCAASSPVPVFCTYRLPDLLTARDVEFGGIGRIAGTVKEDGTPDVPVHRRVRLHREQDGLLVREVWSHPTTGAYSFDHIDTTKRYTVITYDYEHDYRAVIADNITPEAMP